MTGAELELDDLAVTLGGTRILDQVSFRVAPGERVALVGASGSGKSFTAAAVAGLLPDGARTSGRIRLAGVEVLGVPAARRPRGARAAVVLQDTATALNPLVRVGTQLAPRARWTGRGRGPCRAATRDLLVEVGFADPDAVLDRRPGELSGGQRQRVCLALALAARPPLVVADEPTTALDVVTQADVVRVLGERTGGAGPALLFVTHDLAVAAQLCDRIVVLAGGRVVEQGPTAQVLAAPAAGPTRCLVAAARAAADALQAAR